MDDASTWAERELEDTKQLWRDVFLPSGTYFHFPAERLDLPRETDGKSKGYKKGRVHQVLPDEPGEECPVQDEHLAAHLRGEIVLGIVPITPDGLYATCLTGDIDVKVDMAALSARARELGVPIRFHWTKSEGAHFIGRIPANTPVLQAHQASRGIAVLLGLSTSAEDFEAYPKLGKNECLFNALCGDRLGGVDTSGEPQRPKQWLLEVASLPVPKKAQVKEWARLGRDDGATSRPTGQRDPEPDAEATAEQCVEFARRMLDHHCTVLSELGDGKQRKTHGVAKHMARMRDDDGHWIEQEEVRDRLWEAGGSAVDDFTSHFNNGWRQGLTLPPVEIHAIGGRPVVRVVGGMLPSVVDDAEDALLDNGDLYQRGDFVVRASREPMLVSDEREVVGLRLVRVGVPNLREHFSRTADFQKYDGRTKRWHSIDPPGEIATTYLARVGEWRLRVLTGIAGAPTLRSDGSILDTPGYDSQTGILYDPGDTVFPPVPSDPTHTDAEAALAVVVGLLEEYPFTTDAARAVALSAILTGLVRRSLDHAPMHAFTAPTAGSGKSNLVDLAAAFATGHEAPVIVASGDDEEFEKRLGSLLLAGDVVVSFDNCDHPLRGAILNQVLTQTMVKIRILGKSETPTVISNTLVCATGNNLVIAGDLTRRSLLCCLDPAVERPELRQFRDLDPVLRVKADRARYVVAGLTVLRAYVAAGSPDMGLPPLNGFHGWSRMVRCPLVWLGTDDPVTTQELLRESDPELENIVAVFNAWEAAGGLHQTSSASQLVRLANLSSGDWDQRTHPVLHDALHAVAGRGPNIDPKALGFWLNRVKDRIVGGMVVRRDGETGGSARWRFTTARWQPAGLAM
jgi:hypothetical protein